MLKDLIFMIFIIYMFTSQIMFVMLVYVEKVGEIVTRENSSKIIKRSYLIGLIPAMLIFYFLEAIKRFGSEFYYDWR